MKFMTTYMIIMFGLAIGSPLFSAEPDCSFDKGNCALVEIIDKAENMDVPNDITWPVGIANPIAKNTGTTLHEVSEQIHKLEPYIQAVLQNGIRQQIFNGNAALKDGLSISSVLLAHEIVGFQNEMMRAMAAGETNVLYAPIDALKYPRLAVFLALKPQKSTIKTTIRDGIVECGDWYNPIPSCSPRRYFSTSYNLEQSLVGMDFHKTVEYACEPYCQNTATFEWVDFTKPVSSESGYGICESPKFRYHGRIESQTTYSVQYGEPNPEVFSYEWPYPAWGVYVKWWHENITDPCWGL